MRRPPDACDVGRWRLLQPSEPMLLLRVLDAAPTYGEDGLAFRQARRVVNLAHAGLALALAEEEPCLAGVADDMAADVRDLRAHHGGRPATGRGLDLVRDDDGYSMLVGDALQLPKESVQRLLALCQLISALVVCAEEAGAAVNNQECVPRLTEYAAHLGQELLLVFGVVGARVRHVLQNVLLVEAISLGDRDQPLRAERALGVNV
mmetsp:Transcript_69818/g.197830  ORF Transcript_69818/g.197830 Transcript_69818/m.197830 type:complete len:206 (+) Transcript_69818:161-778(+)